MICVLPFNSISIGSGGELRPCCNSNNRFPYQLLSNSTVDEIINHQEIQALRSAFLRKEKPEICQRCWDIEDRNVKSFRMNANENRFYGIANNEVINFSRYANFDQIQYLDITLGNKCNLACRMCIPSSSSLVSKQWLEMGRIQNTNHEIMHSDESKEKILDLIDRCANLNTIYMLGGEPLVVDFHDEMLEYIIKKGRSKFIALNYNTNLQIDLERKMDLWKHFRAVDIGVSIDGERKTYEYIRWPGKWQKVVDNLTRIFTNNYNIHVNIATTVQNLNVDNLTSLLQEITVINQDLQFYFIPVSGPHKIELISPTVLMNEINKLKSLKSHVYKLPDLISLLNSKLEDIVKVKQRDAEDFFFLQKQYDQLRKQNLFEVKPHFLEVADRFKIETW
jgi:molybdenum cofactor biosynthesis enzyme MoaA